MSAFHCRAFGALTEPAAAAAAHFASAPARPPRLPFVSADVEKMNIGRLTTKPLLVVVAVPPAVHVREIVIVRMPSMVGFATTSTVQDAPPASSAVPHVSFVN